MSANDSSMAIAPDGPPCVNNAAKEYSFPIVGDSATCDVTSQKSVASSIADDSTDCCIDSPALSDEESEVSVLDVESGGDDIHTLAREALSDDSVKRHAILDQYGVLGARWGCKTAPTQDDDLEEDVDDDDDDTGCNDTWKAGLAILEQYGAFGAQWSCGPMPARDEDDDEEDEDEDEDEDECGIDSREIGLAILDQYGALGARWTASADVTDDAPDKPARVLEKDARLSRVQRLWNAARCLLLA